MTVRELYERLGQIMKKTPNAANWVVREWHSNREVEVAQVTPQNDVTLIPFYVEETRKL